MHSVPNAVMRDDSPTQIAALYPPDIGRFYRLASRAGLHVTHHRDTCFSLTTLQQDNEAFIHTIVEICDRHHYEQAHPRHHIYALQPRNGTARAAHVDFAQVPLWDRMPHLYDFEMFNFPSRY